MLREFTNTTAASAGKLGNGLTYTILPNAVPGGRFEAHLQIMAGSADETEAQQGMAHMCEHVSYMGSRKRERLFGTSSQTNAQTDFHHTVYWAACPTLRPSTQAPMLPLALDALLDVMQAKFETHRVEKERSAILSEAAMVNTIDYRVEVQLLAALHGENRLHRRFPIGMIDQIKSWTPEQVKQYHKAHYRPNNAHLYVIGDINAVEAEDLIGKMFSELPARDPPTYLPEEGVDDVNLKQVNSFFPPINHEWMGSRVHGEDEHRVHVFQHELMQCASIHVFAKFPVEPIRSLAEYRRALIKRLVVVAMQVRLNVNARGEPISMVEFSHLDSPREACAVCALDMMANADNWQEAVKIVGKEIKKMAAFGLSMSELQRCLSALLSDSEQLASQGDRMTNQEQLQFLMESVSCGHTFMDPHQLQLATQLVAQTLTLEEVNAEAATMCNHLAKFGEGGAPMPSSVVVCAPTTVSVSADDIIETLRSAASQDVEALAEVIVPETLIAKEIVAQKMLEHQPLVMSTDKIKDEDYPMTGVCARRLSNGVRFNYHYSDTESQRGHLRVTVPSGRISETGKYKSGALAVGARTMQEGGAMGGLSREQVELFCVDHLIMAEFACNEELLFMEFVFPTTKVTSGENVVSGMEGVFQVLHAVLAGEFLWEEDAFQRAKQAFIQTHEQVSKSMEAAAAEHLLGSMCGGDERFLSVSPSALAELTLQDVKTAVTDHLKTGNIEVSVCGDFDREDLERLAAQYLGTIPATESAQEIVAQIDGVAAEAPLPCIPMMPSVPNRDLYIEIKDSDPRAVAYVAGRAPNRWGVMSDGTRALAQKQQETSKSSKTQMVRTLFTNLVNKGMDSAQAQDAELYRQHALYPCMTLMLLTEILNRRLFSTVREKKRLTYDANFHLTGFERIQGGWYLVTVTAKPEQAQAALDACKETLQAARTWDPITENNLQSAAYELVSKHQGALQTNRYWVDLMSGLQLDGMPDKTVDYIRDFVPLVNSIRVSDVQAMLENLSVDEQDIWSCIGSSGHTTSDVAVGDGDEQVEEDHGHSAPMNFGRSRL